MNVSGTGLSTVLKVKVVQEKNAQRELAAIAQKREVEEQRLDQLEQTQDSALTQASGVTRSRAGDLQTSRAFIQSINKQIEQQGETVDDVKNKESAKRDELVERSKSRQMVESLDTKRKEEAEKEKERKAQRVIDVLAQRMKIGM
ncbi:MAG TPA: flagellar export protein FliJ [Bacteroidota bacterium]|nr:flagellar export protein FliJ [Bacteroidota bacterium]